MEDPDLYDEAWEGIRKSFEDGRLAHAYILVGSPRREALSFAESFLKLLFCENDDKPCGQCTNCHRIDTHNHVDTHWIEPQSKARNIKADEIRALVHRLAQTAFAGGWKAGILVSAECMNPTAANILLKTLEEPPPKTLLLLITDSPQALLPTITSRCQKVVLSKNRSGRVETFWKEPLLKILCDLPPSDGLGAARLAGQLKALFGGVKKGIAEAIAEDIDPDEGMLDVSKRKAILEARTSALLKEVQADVFRVMLDWQRDVLMQASGVGEDHLIFSRNRDTLRRQAERHTRSTALEAVRVVEKIPQRLDRNIPDGQVFDEAFRLLIRKQAVSSTE
jgi:DNA polymerase-3 subunit delta'